ncbi:MAG: hypothetical protein Q4C47_00415, partial [Planctomycetia bacterium]|nr:hypothetical protein [Planctomycetia bacterium]
MIDPAGETEYRRWAARGWAEGLSWSLRNPRAIGGGWSDKWCGISPGYDLPPEVRDIGRMGTIGSGTLFG